MKLRRARRAAPAPSTFSSRWLATRLRELVGPLAQARLCVAFSGGADSTALLVAAAALRTAGGLRALHVHHHLQPAADAWARAARRRARSLGVPCTVLHAPVRPARGESVEVAARTARYAALQGALEPGEWLLLAQHQDDQLETVLLQLLRGAGIAGLAAMPQAAGALLRPLLAITRAQLRAYLRRRRLEWSEDASNHDERFDRNFLRLRVTPLLLERWPAAAATVSRSAALAAQAQQLLAAQADRDLLTAHDGPALQVSALRRLAPAARSNALRRWLDLRGLPMPDQRRLQEIAGPMLRARHDAQPLVEWPGAQVRRQGALLHALIAVPGAPAAAAPRLRQPWHWRRDAILHLPGGACLELRREPHGNLDLAALPPEVELRFRAGGERFAAAHGAATLKRLMQQRRLPAWSRGQVPLLYADDRLIAVADWWCEPPLRAAPAPGAAEIARARLYWRLPI